MTEVRKKLTLFISIIWLGYQLYIGLVRPLHPLLQNSVHLMLGLLIVFCHYPAGKKWKQLIDVAIAIALIVVIFHLFKDFDRLQRRIPYVNPVTAMDILAALILVAAVLEAVRRSLGYSLYFFMITVLCYGFLGRFFPGMMRFRGLKLPAFTDLMIMTTDGLFSTPLGTSANTLYYFIFFGIIFATLGGGKVLLDIGLRFSNTASGGPGKAAVISSSLVGTVSGSAVANVSTTGVITIPFMKKAGYKPEQAAAIEAIASTGGQIMPPIMGVGAFIMAELLGRPYSHIALAAVIPALVYYFSIFILVDFLARKQHIDTVPVKIEVDKILPRLHFLIPLLFVIVSIFMGISLMTTAIRGSVLAILVSMITREFRFNLSRGIEILIKATIQSAKVAVPTASAGLVIGIVIHSGFAQRLSSVMGIVGGGNIFFALLLAMTGCILLGMALPTVAAYVIAAILFAPTMIRLGLPPLVAHMFIFYFGVIAQITPPVCLASYTAAGIAEADTWKTAWTGFFYALVTFMIPYVFVYKNELLLMGTAGKIAESTVILIIGTLFLVASVSGYFIISLKGYLLRFLFLGSALLTIIPDMTTTFLGLASGALLAGYCYYKYKQNMAAKNIMAGI